MKSSTIIHTDGEHDVLFIEEDGKYALNLAGYPFQMGAMGPQQMDVKAALTLAAGILQAVSVTHAPYVDELVQDLDYDPVGTLRDIQDGRYAW